MRRVAIVAIVGGAAFVVISALAGLTVGLIVGAIAAMMAYELHFPSDPGEPPVLP